MDVQRNVTATKQGILEMDPQTAWNAAFGGWESMRFIGEQIFLERDAVERYKRARAFAMALATGIGQQVQHVGEVKDSETTSGGVNVNLGISLSNKTNGPGDTVIRSPISLVSKLLDEVDIGVGGQVNRSKIRSTDEMSHVDLWYNKIMTVYDKANQQNDPSRAITEFSQGVSEIAYNAERYAKEQTSQRFGRFFGKHASHPDE